MFVLKIVCPEIVSAINGVNATLVRIFKQLRQPAAPTNLRFALIGEFQMALRYQFTADPPQAVDVVKRTLTVNGTAQDFAADSVDFGTMDFEQDSEVTVSLVDTDDAGNASDPLTTTFTAHDTIPPGTPTGIGVTLVAEV